MDHIKKIPNKKLRIGAMIALISSIITTIFNISISIILIVNSSLIFTFTSKIIIIGAGISLLIGIGFAIAIIILCNNTLKGKATNGLVVGILSLVLAGVFLIFNILFTKNSVASNDDIIVNDAIIFFANRFVAFINGILLILYVAAGILLIKGKYLPEDLQSKVVTAV